jgi:hypothetical protein
VRSIYFDTPGLACLVQKEAGIHTRRKLRVRGYGARREDSLVVLEIKRKFDMRVSKNRAFLPYAGLAALLASGDVERFILTQDTARQAQSLQSARAFLFHLYRYAMHPVVLVAYEREAFFGRFDPSVRLTFDKGLRGRGYPPLAELFAEEGLTRVMSEHFILEVKFQEGMPSWIGAILEDFGLERRALSKFGICLERERMGRGASSRAVWAAYRPPGEIPAPPRVPAHRLEH